MKNRYLLFFLPILFLLASCSFLQNIDIKKRHYRNGFYVHIKRESSFAKDSIEPIVPHNFSTFSNTYPKKIPVTIQQSIVKTEAPKKVNAHKTSIIKTSFQKFPKIPRHNAIKPTHNWKAPAPDWLIKLGKTLLVILISAIFPLWLFILVADMVLDPNENASVAGELLVVIALFVSIAWIAAIVLLILANPLWLLLYLIIMGIEVIAFIAMCVFYTSDVTI